LRRAAALAFAGLLGCVSPVELDHAVLEYDRAVNRVEAELLLLNIARARHHRPIHFTAVSSIAATYDFRLDAAAVGRFGPSPDDAPADVLFGASFAENPTITIVPISGQEFTTRVLRPLEEAQFQLLGQQDFPLDIGGAAARARSGLASRAGRVASPLRATRTARTPSRTRSPSRGPLGAAVLLRSFPSPWLVFAFFALLLLPGTFCNALFHLGASVATRTYCAGALTGLVVYVPLSLLLAVLAVQEGLMSASALVAALGVAAVFHTLEVGHNVFERW